AMVTDAGGTILTAQDGVLAGPYREPHNQYQQSAGSIHNDDVARPLGFRGGTVAGIIHHEQFAPLLLRAFGRRWFEHGSLSLYYRNASTHSEKVKASLQLPAVDATDTQVDVWMDHENGLRVLEGTASVGASPDATGLRRRFENRPAPGDVRILRHLPIGSLMPEVPVRVSREAQEGRRPVITEPLEWYWGDSPWGGPICTPVTMFRLLNPAFTLRETITDVVGLYGGIEIRVVDGPLFVERDYVAQGRLLEAGSTPKSEYLWWEAQLRDGDSTKVVAEMLMMSRFMKGSSPLYAER
ncbi:MAG: hypothetical protein ACRDJE_19870, partial [Dehalococcoidia bacterium]